MFFFYPSLSLSLLSLSLLSLSLLLLFSLFFSLPPSLFSLFFFPSLSFPLFSPSLYLPLLASLYLSLLFLFFSHKVSGLEFTGSADNDIRVIGFAVVSLLLVIALIGLDWEAKVWSMERPLLSHGQYKMHARFPRSKMAD